MHTPSGKVGGLDDWLRRSRRWLLAFAALAGCSRVVTSVGSNDSAQGNTPPATTGAGAPRIFFSDLERGPNTGGQDNHGAFVTIYGRRFGDTRGASTVTVGGGAVHTYPIWSDTKIAFQLGTDAVTGTIVVHTAAGESNGLGFTVRDGRILFVAPNGTGDGSYTSPMSPSALYGATQPGDTFYFRAGTYSGEYGNSAWGDYNFTFGQPRTGTSGSPVSIVGYPGETAILESPSTDKNGNIALTDGNGVAEYYTVANLTFKGGTECIHSGGIWTQAHSGATGVRVVGNVFSARYTGNTGGDALVNVKNDHWRVLGNEFKDTGTSPPDNANHAIDVQSGAGDIEMGWNSIHDLRMGHVIQVHTDIAYAYEDVRIHDNVISAKNPADCRGINVGTVLSATHGVIYNNILHNIGQDFSAIAVYGGDFKIFNNTLYNVNSSAGMVWLSGAFGSQPTAQIFNNIFYSDGHSPYVAVFAGLATSAATLSNNLYYNAGPGLSQDGDAINEDPLFASSATGDFRPRRGSPAIDRGSSAASPVVSVDHDGVSRPQGAAFDIGAYEQ